jgi:cytosine/adenosine deaminase-related metal-dependent hydrolase
MIIRARTVVTMDGAPIDNGAVAVSDDRIDDSPPGSSPSRAARLCRSAPAGSVVDVGKFDEIATRNAGEIIDLGEQALLPGLINAHCHLDYTCLRGKIPPQNSFAERLSRLNQRRFLGSQKIRDNDHRESHCVSGVNSEDQCADSHVVVCGTD